MAFWELGRSAFFQGHSNHWENLREAFFFFWASSKYEIRVSVNIPLNNRVKMKYSFLVSAYSTVTNCFLIFGVSPKYKYAGQNKKDKGNQCKKS